MSANVSRRDVLKMLALAPAMGSSHATGSALAQSSAPAAAVPRPLEIGIVSRHLQFTSMEEAIAIAKEVGFDSIEWNVRNGGHVTPPNVARELPRCIDLTRKAGLSTPMITTSIADATSPVRRGHPRSRERARRHSLPGRGFELRLHQGSRSAGRGTQATSRRHQRSEYQVQNRHRLSRALVGRARSAAASGISGR